MALNQPVPMSELPSGSAIAQFIGDFLPGIVGIQVQELLGSEFLAQFPGLHVFAVNSDTMPRIVLGVTVDPGSKITASQFSTYLVSAQLEAMRALESVNPSDSQPFIINVSDLRNANVNNFGTGTLTTAQKMFNDSSVLKHIVIGSGVAFNIAYHVFSTLVKSDRIAVYNDNIELARADLSQLLSGEV